jgi:hypothetical protein
MRKVFHFDCESRTYQADAAVVWCFDDRFTIAVQKFLKRREIRRTDSVRVAGGAKPLAAPRDETERSFVLEQLRLSTQLHGTERAILMLHTDCGAYGGLAAFGNDPQVEAAHHQAELARAAAAVRAHIPELAVACYFVGFDGVREVETAGAQRA